MSLRELISPQKIKTSLKASEVQVSCKTPQLSKTYENKDIKKPPVYHKGGF